MQPSLITLLRKYPLFSNLGVWLLVFVLRFFSLFPLPVIYLFSCLLGEIVFWLYGSRRKVTLINISLCLPHLSRYQQYSTARRHFHHLTCSFLSVGIGWWASARRINRLVRIINPEIYQNAIENEENIILLAPHFVFLEFTAIYISKQSSLTSMYMVHKNPLMDELIKSHRSRFGMELFSTNQLLKELIRLTSSGRPFYYLPDQDSGRRRGMFAPFYGIQACTYPVLGRMAKMSKSTVIPCIGLLRPWGMGFDVVFLPPLKPYPTNDTLADVTLMNKRIEHAIDLSPHQYLWSHKRFKTRPLGEPAFYE